MEISFWILLAVVLYTYIGYSIVLMIAVKIKELLKSRSSHSSSSPNNKSSQDEKSFQDDDDESLLPPVTLLICAYNEEDVVKIKMDNTHSLNYPKSKLHVMWVTDGSNDNTCKLLEQYDVEILHRPERRGKTNAMNRGIKAAPTSIVIMTDANTMLNSDAIRNIVKPFADPKTGCVAGEKRVMARTDSQEAAKSEGLYWRYESWMKNMDSRLYSTMGAAGELWAVRQELCDTLPDDTLLDDFMLSMLIVDKGYKIVYAPNAYACEYGSKDIVEEEKRKVRIAAGGLQSMFRLARLANPFRNPVVAFQLISHRLLRWSLAPLCLMLLIPVNTILVITNGDLIYILAWAAQLLFYLLAFWGFLSQNKTRKSKIASTAYYFMFMNFCVFKGVRYLTKHRNSGAWEKAERG